MQKILIIEARFYPHISDLLLQGATQKLKELNHEYDIVEVSGALEIASVINFASTSQKYQGFIALGCIIRGETSHYDIVANESARALTQLALTKNLAIANGILTVENESQALKRADPKQKNKGGFVATACVQLIELQKKFAS